MDENIRGLIVPYYNEDVLHFKLNIDNNTMLDPYNAGQEITPNLTPNGFALPDLVLRGIYSDREKHWLISFVFDVIDTATDAFLTKDKNAGRINAGVDISGEYIFEHYTDALKNLTIQIRHKIMYTLSLMLSILELYALSTEMRAEVNLGLRCSAKIQLRRCSLKQTYFLPNLHIGIKKGETQIKNLSVKFIRKNTHFGYINMKM